MTATSTERPPLATEAGVQLRWYEAHWPGTDVRLSCSCGYGFIVPLAAALALSRQRGRPDMGVVEFAGYVTDPCGRCLQRRWTSRPAFPRASGMTRKVTQCVD